MQSLAPNLLTFLPMRVKLWENRKNQKNAAPLHKCTLLTRISTVVIVQSAESFLAYNDIGYSKAGRMLFLFIIRYQSS